MSDQGALAYCMPCDLDAGNRGKQGSELFSSKGCVFQVRYNGIQFKVKAGFRLVSSSRPGVWEMF